MNNQLLDKLSELESEINSARNIDDSSLLSNLHSALSEYLTSVKPR